MRIGADPLDQIDHPGHRRIALRAPALQRVDAVEDAVEAGISLARCTARYDAAAERYCQRWLSTQTQLPDTSLMILPKTL